MPSGRDALLLAARLPGLKWAKLGPVLFVREGPAVIKEFRQRGIQVFLDFKWHDIPNIVAQAVTAARELGVSMTTVHCLGGRAMLGAAARAAGAGRRTSWSAGRSPAPLIPRRHIATLSKRSVEGITGPCRTSGESLRSVA